MIPMPSLRRPVGCSQHSVDFVLVQIADSNAGRALELHRPQLRRPAEIVRTALSDEGGERMTGCQTLIARGDRAFAVLFEMAQEDPNKIGVDVGDKKPVHLLP